MYVMHVHVTWTVVVGAAWLATTASQPNVAEDISDISGTSQPQLHEYVFFLPLDQIEPDISRKRFSHNCMSAFSVVSGLNRTRHIQEPFQPELH